MNAIYLTESTQTYWIQVLDEYWEERDTTYSDCFELWPQWLFQYFNSRSLGEDNESVYIMWN